MHRRRGLRKTGTSMCVAEATGVAGGVYLVCAWFKQLVVTSQSPGREKARYRTSIKYWFSMSEFSGVVDAFFGAVGTGSI